MDLSRPEIWRDGSVAGHFARLRQKHPIHFCANSRFGHYWSVTRHSDILQVEASADIFSSSFARGGITLANSGPELFPMFISRDPPEHGPQRRAVAPAFGPSAIARLKPAMVERTRALVAGLPAAETCDWGEDVATELATQMLALLFGLPWEERRKLAYWADWAGDLSAAFDKGRARRRVEILWECGAVFLTLRKLREREAAGPDLISLMSHAQGTRELSPQEYLGNLILLIVGAIDTTRSTLNALPLVNALWPSEWEKLRADSSLVPHWAQELIRWQTPLAHMRRTATRDCELGGHRIRAGDKVALWYWSANRDERVFDDAERFQPDRPNVRAHLAFGSGIHRCVGARLAELQISVLLEALLEQRLQPTAGGEVERNGNCFSNGYTKVIARLARS